MPVCEVSQILRNHLLSRRLLYKVFAIGSPAEGLVHPNCCWKNSGEHDAQLQGTQGDAT